MDLLIGIAIGLAAYHLFWRLIGVYTRTKLGSAKENQIRRALLDKMGYDGLSSLADAVEKEIERRRARA